MGFSAQCNTRVRVIIFTGWLALRILVTTANVNVNFTIDSSEFACGGNIRCNLPAHVADPSLGPLAGMLSLIQENSNWTNTWYKASSAFWQNSVKMRNGSRPASFNTSFVFTERTVNGTNKEAAGDGMAFVLVADYLNGTQPNSGSEGEYLGCFGPNGTNNHKAVVVEFDNYYNENVNDPGWNHVSLDLQNITNIASYGNASDLGIEMWGNGTVYAWIEYRYEELVLEVRISSDPSRPDRALFAYTNANLFDSFDDNMWVGFSAATGGKTSFYYVESWTFYTYGIETDGSNVTHV